MGEVQTIIEEEKISRVIAEYTRCYNLDSAFAMAGISQEDQLLMKENPSFMQRLAYHKNKATGDMIAKIQKAMNSKNEIVVLNACKLMSKVLDYDKLTTNNTKIQDGNGPPVSITIDGESVT